MLWLLIFRLVKVLDITYKKTQGLKTLSLFLTSSLFEG